MKVQIVSILGKCPFSRNELDYVGDVKPFSKIHNIHDLYLQVNQKITFDDIVVSQFCLF